VKFRQSFGESSGTSQLSPNGRGQRPEVKESKGQEERQEGAGDRSSLFQGVKVRVFRAVSCTFCLNQKGSEELSSEPFFVRPAWAHD